MNIKIENDTRIYPELSLYNFNLKNCVEDASVSFIFNGDYVLNSLTSEDIVNDLDDSCLYADYATHTGLVLTQVSGDALCFDIDGNYFNGGFYQSTFKLHSYPYQMLPICFDDGFALEFMLNLTGETCSPSLNDIYPDNKGFIFYMGLKKENPYLGSTGDVVSCDGIRYNDTIIDDTVYPWEQENPFLVYTESFVCSGITLNYDYNIKYDYNDIIDNAFGIRITDDGRVNLRYITKGTPFSVVNHYTDSIIPSGQTTHLIINFEQVLDYDPCNDIDKLLNVYVWVNGFMVQKFCIPNLSLKGLSMQKEHQIGIPYNISVGGGTLGLLYDEIYTEDKNMCIYDICLSANTANFIEYSYDGNVYTTNTPISDIEKFIQDNFDKEFKVYLTSKNKRLVYKGRIKTTKKIEYIRTDSSCSIEFSSVNCHDVSIHPNDVITSNFSGSFTGYLYCFNFYNSYLTVQDIRHKLNNNCIGASFERCYVC